MSNNIVFDGLEEILKQLDETVDSKKVDAALGKAAAMVEASAKKKAPKDSGALRRSITSKVENHQGIIFTPLEYAPYIEYGTGIFAEQGGRQDEWSYQDDEGNWHSTNGQKPQPYMRPALDENRANIMRILKEGILND